MVALKLLPDLSVILAFMLPEMLVVLEGGELPGCGPTELKIFTLPQKHVTAMRTAP